MAAKSAGLEFDDFHNWSALGGNYANEKECRSVWKSFDESGPVTPATLYGMAFAQGWKDPSKLRERRTYHPIAKPKQTAPKPVKTAANLGAVDVWARCVAATVAEPYIDRKRGLPDGLRVYPAGAPSLMIRGHRM